MCHFEVTFSFQLHAAFVSSEVAQIAELGGGIQDDVCTVGQNYSGFIALVGFHNEG